MIEVVLFYLNVVKVVKVHEPIFFWGGGARPVRAFTIDLNNVLGQNQHFLGYSGYSAQSWKLAPVYPNLPLNTIVCPAQRNNKSIKHNK